MSDVSTTPITRPYEGLPWARGSMGVPEPVVSDEHSVIDSARATIAPGARVDRYLLEQEIGSGGMGVVYSALDTRLNRRVALKLVRTHTRSGKVIRRAKSRLLREAQALARISHPNIVALYDVGGGEHGMYLAMEYLEGHSLRHWLRAKERSWKQIVAAFIQAGRGLAAAHRAGIVHRDFKPNNVQVGVNGRVAVLDFGLARAMPNALLDGNRDQGSSSSALGSPLLDKRLTEVGIVLGTAGYMAPEQLMGKDVGCYSDQFSFCVGLYEALYEQKPYPGETAVQLAVAYRKGALRPMPEGVTAPPRLFEVLRRGLHADPRDRYDSMEELLHDLGWDPSGRRKRAARHH